MVAVSRSATPDPARGAAASSTLPGAVEAAPGAPENDGRCAGSTAASDRRSAILGLMRAHGDAVLGFCVRLLRDHELAEEVRQQTFLDAFRDFDRFQDRSSRRAWLFGIASHRCLDAIRKQQRHSRLIENDEAAVVGTRDPGTGPSGHVEHVQLTSALEDCLKLLSPEVQMTVLMRFQTELTYEELAVKLAARADALQVRVARALSSLRRCLENKGIYDA
jgi:RNA polymerase sigma factor (sigma-70 family)